MRHSILNWMNRLTDKTISHMLSEADITSMGLNCCDKCVYVQIKSEQQNQIKYKYLSCTAWSLGCCFHEDYNIMAFKICINRFWLVGGKAFILIGFPLLHMYNWCQSSAVDANYHTDKRLYSFHEISMSCTDITKYIVRVLDRHPSEKGFRADT